MRAPPRRRGADQAAHSISVAECGGSFVTSAFKFSSPPETVGPGDESQRRARMSALLLHNLPAVKLFLQRYVELNDYALEYLDSLGKSEL